MLAMDAKMTAMINALGSDMSDAEFERRKAEIYALLDEF